MPTQTETTMEEANPLPVRAVTLFASGVAYTLREGDVDAGETSVALTFRTNQINDILKSLVLLDAGGDVQAVTYPSRDPVGRTLQAFAIDVSGDPSRGTLLRQLRGTPVAIETVSGETLSGRIVSVEQREQAVGDNMQTVELLNLLSEDGLLTLPFDRIRLLRLLDARLDKEFRDALMTLASGSDDNRRVVTLRFTGEEARHVRVGYVSESPVWKVSYRLVLPDAPDANTEGTAAAPYLQGWALVENTTDDDWQDVRLSLVSGRPVSFIQDLYQPLYVPRPVVAPDIIASPTPQVHESPFLMQESGAFAGFVDSGDNFEPVPAPASAPLRAAYLMKAASSDRSPVDIRALTVSSQAQGDKAGELFAYHIASPVSLPRQQAAMIPIVAENIEGEKLSLYNAQTAPRFPLNAVRLKNNTGLHLKAGPITLFDSGIYAGDARMEDIPPGDTRLLTYAVDLAVEVHTEENQVDAETVVGIRRGVLQSQVRLTRTITVTLSSKLDTARRVLVEHPLRSDWQLVSPAAPADETAHFRRFEVRLTPRETQRLIVVEEQLRHSEIALLHKDIQALHIYADSGNISPQLQEVFSRVMAERRAITGNNVVAVRLEKERAEIFTEQERLRANMGAVTETTGLYRRYLTELEAQENRLQVLRDEIARLRAEAETLTNSLNAYLDSLDITL